jgi:hypothetical protein
MNPSRVLPPLVLYAASAFLHVAAAADDALPAAASASISEAFPGTRVVEWGKGALSRPGAEDMAVVVEREGQQHIPDQALAVLQQRPGGGYTLAGKSRFWSGNDRVHWNVEIREHSVMLVYDCASRCGQEATKGSYQFKAVGGALALVGEDEVTYTNPRENDDQVGFSKNYLRRTAIYWRKSGRKRIEVRKRFPAFAPIGLSRFDRWEEQDSRPREARGMVDERFHFTTY